MTSVVETDVVVPMTAQQRDEFEQNGFLVIPGALSESEVAFYAEALDRVYAVEQAAGRLSPEGAMHLLSAVTHCPEAVGLIDHPRTFPLVWSILGWNVHIYHSHLDVHPPIRVPKPFRFEWHQDGGRQNRELETDPRPRLSVKLACWLSDVSEQGRGNLKVVPGSHRQNRIDGPPRRDVEWPEPEGAIEVRVNPGDVVFFDRRLWHARSDNYSEITRKAMFFGYTLRWIAIRDEVGALQASPEFESLSPVRKQLLGGVSRGIAGQLEGDHGWGHYPETTPLHGYLKERGLLAAGNPPLRPLTKPLPAEVHRCRAGAADHDGGVLAGLGNVPAGQEGGECPASASRRRDTSYIAGQSRKTAPSARPVLRYGCTRRCAVAVTRQTVHSWRSGGLR
jgi:ectoine hydroxylase